MEVVVAFGDKDLLQLASDQIMIVIPKTKNGGTEIESYYADDVKKRYSVTPSEFIDLKALMGDSSDNIPGIPGIGEKTATKIIARFGSLENAYAHVEITPNRAQNNLKEFIEQGRMSRALAEININSPVSMDFHEAKIENEQVFYNDDSYTLYKKLELRKLLERFNMTDVSGFPEFIYEVEDAEKMPEYFTRAGRQQGGIGLYLDESCSVASLTYQDREELKTVVFEGTVPDLLPLLVSGTEIYVFGLKDLLHANAGGKCQGALDNGQFSNVYDLFLMSYLQDPLKTSYTYDSVCKDQTGELVPSREELIGKLSVKEALGLTKQEKLP